MGEVSVQRGNGGRIRKQYHLKLNVTKVLVCYIESFITCPHFYLPNEINFSGITILLCKRKQSFTKEYIYLLRREQSFWAKFRPNLNLFLALNARKRHSVVLTKCAREIEANSALAWTCLRAKPQKQTTYIYKAKPELVQLGRNGLKNEHSSICFSYSICNYWFYSKNLKLWLLPLSASWSPIIVIL